MKRIGIITLYHNNDNYGGIAQAYALNQYLCQSGYCSELISYKRSPVHLPNTKQLIRKHGIAKVVRDKTEMLPQKSYYRFANRAAKKKYGKQLSAALSKRKQAFALSRADMPHSIEVTEQNISSLANAYDCFISGSDQIWKPGVLQAPYLLTFLDEKTPRFSYASSITAQELPQEQQEQMAQALQAYRWISVREESAKALLEPILHRPVDVVVDPTLLLTAEDWLPMCSERLLDERYLFVYLLGNNFKQRKIITRFAKKQGLKIVTLPHVEGKIRASDVKFGDVQLYDVGLPQFLSLIRHADYICTDSFHAVVFANIFETDFSIFERIVLAKRHNMNSRLDTLLQALGEQDRFVGRFGTPNPDPIDFAAAKKRLQPKIDHSKALLHSALDFEEAAR